jgi:hypothetical protein
MPFKDLVFSNVTCHSRTDYNFWMDWKGATGDQNSRSWKPHKESIKGEKCRASLAHAVLCSRSYFYPSRLNSPSFSITNILSYFCLLWYLPLETSFLPWKQVSPQGLGSMKALIGRWMSFQYRREGHVHIPVPWFFFHLTATGNISTITYNSILGLKFPCLFHLCFFFWLLYSLQ